MPTFIAFSHLRWNAVRQRPQHLMTQLAQHDRVVFVEEPVHDVDAPACLECNVQGPNLQVLVPHLPIGGPGFHDGQIELLEPLLDAWLADQGLGDDRIAWFFAPMALPLIEQWQPRLVIYDCIAELGAQKDAPLALRAREAALLARADLVLTAGPSLYQAKRRLRPDALCLPSAVDVERFAPPVDRDAPEARAAAALQDALPGPRLGFFGVIDERIDLALVDQLAAARPDWQIVMAGPVARIDEALLPQRPNIHWLGLQPYERLPALMADWDACLMPFALNDATLGLSPAQTLEYLAGEKPVVSTALPDVVSLYGDLVAVARTNEDFVALCDAALHENAWQRHQRLVRTTPTLYRASWAQRAQFIRSLIAERLTLPATLPPPRREAAGAMLPTEG